MITLIIPSLNEEASISTLLTALLTILPADGEVIIVDDGSTDGTRARMQAFTDTRIHVIVRTERGLASAVVRGFQEAQGDILVVMDADLSHPVSVVPRLITALDDQSIDLVVASRLIFGGGVEEWPLHRKMFSWCATLIARPLSKGVCDPMSGFFALRKNVIEGVVLAPRGYKILLEVLVKGSAKRVIEIPYTFRNRTLGKSKISARIMGEYVQQLVQLYVKKFFLR